MKIFAIHRGKDAKQIEKISEKIKDYRTGFLQLNSTTRFWHAQAKKLIARADIVIYFVGDEITDNIRWELKIAEKLKKPIYIYKLDENIEYFDDIIYKDEYGIKNSAYPELNFQTLTDLKLSSEPSVKEMLYNDNINDNDSLLEQYKIMIETTENSIERRQKVSSTYITIISMFMPIISAMLASTNKWLNLSSVVVAVISTILCFSWINTINSYGVSNSAKFEIIENIEKALPLSIFKAEWYVRSARNKKIYSFTSREKNVPKIFVIINIAFLILAVVLFFCRHYSLI